MITVINCGTGNIGSTVNMLKKVGVSAVVGSKVSDIENADKLILPGVGAFDSGIMHLNELGIIEVLNHKVLTEKTPILGICLGMQLLTNGSEEGTWSGLGYINAEAKKFSFQEQEYSLKVPHMGWNSVTIHKDSPLFKNMYQEMRFYFVHSYHVVCNNPGDILTTTPYGFEFVSSLQHENIMGTQFHPEKSHKYGKLLLENFARF
ncbi:MAG: imidazole glycerol phosphate synthase subunit HisH [Candidatus Roizmanbacteria bacterium]|nr:imidazole glycerol phosphate synthase subunit HisH [Candidatus Roizmanbacteria bacterium]